MSDATTEVEVTQQLRSVAENIASRYLNVSVSEAEELAKNDTFARLSAANDLLFTARGDAVHGSDADSEIVDLTVTASSDITYLLHLKAEEILDREITTPEPTDGGEAGE